MTLVDVNESGSHTFVCNTTPNHLLKELSPFVRMVDVPNVRQIYIMTGYDLSQRERI